MQCFPDHAKFIHPWRIYQKRVLDELHDHLEDEHLHIIAPPGSGKTILGLEVVRRLNSATIIFTPSINIRNQWVNKFYRFFLNEKVVPDWISTDIKNPKYLTVTTYQSLLALNDDGKEGLNELISFGFQTFVLDEAHHLQNAWWKCLYQLKNELSPKLISLTATPPYDASAGEWDRYSLLNGPVDTEISVPELVSAGDLCPHQDYIYLSIPTQSEKHKIAESKAHIDSLKQEFLSISNLIEIVQELSCIKEPNEDIHWIYNNPEAYSSMLVFLKSKGVEIDKRNLDIIGNQMEEIPDLSDDWLQVFIGTILCHDFKFLNDEHKKTVRYYYREFKKVGAINHGRLELFDLDYIGKQLKESLSKLNSINEIVRHEHETFGRKLHMVILSDYIRKEFLSKSNENKTEINRLGVIPIFEFLRRNQRKDINLAVLTGSIVIIHRSTISALNEYAKEKGLHDLKYKPLPYDSNYLKIDVNTATRQKIVLLTTQLFENGKIEILIGTKSLLGEGWDAPSINSLILASFVGSYVLSNQMRGRAIRSSISNKSKTGNIWHLVCLDPNEQYHGQDYKKMERRFKAFVGVSMDEEPYISNGIKRLHLNESLLLKKDVEHINHQTLIQAEKRNLLKDRWDKALASGQEIIEEIEISSESYPFNRLGSTIETSKSSKGYKRNYKEQKKFYWNRTIASLAVQLGSVLAMGAEAYIQGLFRNPKIIHSNTAFFTFTGVFLGLTLIASSGLLIKYLRLYLNFRDINKDIHNISICLLHSLSETEQLQSKLEVLRVSSSVDEQGQISCSLENSHKYERTIFNSNLLQIVSKIKNPRYLIIRKSKKSGVIQQRDYHSVPDILGANSKSAQIFEKNWNKFVGKGEIIYTRTKKGRRFLLKVRGKSLSAQIDPDPKVQSRWR